MQRDAGMLSFRRLIQRLLRRGDQRECAREAITFACEGSMLVQAETLRSTPPPAPDEEEFNVNSDEGATDEEGSEEHTSFRWRRHPQLLQRAQQDETARPSRTPGQREARAAAVQGMYLARGGRHEEAQKCFVRAAREETIDLTEVPGFWSLSRSAMQSVIDAYEVVGRLRDASALAAKLRTTYRPRVVTTPRVTPLVAARPPSSWKQTGSE